MMDVRQPWIIQSQLLMAIQSNDVKFCISLLSDGADLDQSFRINCQRRQSICIGAERGFYQLVELFLENGVSVHRRDSNGSTALHYASEMGYEDIIDLLLKYKADTNASNRLGITPLHLAVKTNKISLVQKMINRGANVSAKDFEDKTPLMYACFTPNVDPQIIQLLLSNGPSWCINDMDAKGNTPLMFAVEYNLRIDILQLISAKAVLNIRNKMSLYPIHRLLYNDSDMKHQALKLMIENNCYLNVQDIMGHTPLHIACVTGDTLSAKMLIIANAKVNCCDRIGNTPLYYCVTHGRQELTLLLLNTGACRCPLLLSKSNALRLSESLAYMLNDKLSSPMSLKEMARTAVYRRFGSNTMRWLDQNSDQIPLSLRDFLLLK